MRKPDSCNLSHDDSITLYMMEWWIRKNIKRIDEAIGMTDVNDHSSIKLEEVGAVILRNWPTWKEDFMSDVQKDDFASYLWKSACRYSLVQRRCDWSELYARIGKEASSWVSYNKNKIAKNRRRLSTIKRVQES